VAPLVLQNIANANPSIRVTIVCLDLPGHGLSDHRTKDSDYADWRYALDVEACVQQLRWKRFSLLAHSMVGTHGTRSFEALSDNSNPIPAGLGFLSVSLSLFSSLLQGGAVSCYYSAAYPNKVQSICLIDNVAVFTRPVQQIPEELLERIEEEKALARKRKPRYASVEAATTARSNAPRIPLGYEGASRLVSRGLMEIVEEDTSAVSDPFGQKVRLAPTVASSPDGRRPEAELAPVHGKDLADPDRKRAFTWRTDQRLTLSDPFPPTEATCLEICKRIGRARVPVLLILASGGYFVKNINDGQGLRWEKRCVADIPLESFHRANRLFRSGFGLWLSEPKSRPSWRGKLEREEAKSSSSRAAITCTWKVKDRPSLDCSLIC